MTDTADKYTDFDGNPLPAEDVEALKRLEERAQAPAAEGWRPEPGDTLTGRVMEIDSGSSEFGVYPLLTIRKTNGQEVAAHCFHTVLQNRIEHLIETGKLHEGSLISIKYLEQTESTKKGQSGAHIYKVVVE